jgi:methylated-DNA-[protein]-cysteine S-methyltransferase
MVAEAAGRPGAARVVGAAMAANPFAPVIPCHRVVGSDGTLRGYGGGLEMKQAMLDMERGVLPLDL